MSAAAARAAQLESVADNLANAESPGFKAARPAFQAFLPQNGRDKILASTVATGTDLRPGVTVPTEGPLDVIPEGDLFLAVQTPNGLAYTRNGKIEIAQDGTLVVAGRPLVGRSGGPITIPEGATPRIEETGEVIADGTALDSLALFRVQGPMDRVGQTLLAPAAGVPVTEEPDARVRVGELELGNAPPLESAVQMINAQRHFETAMQAIQTYRKLDERAIEVGRVR
jgi:flagellar basal-body rod protein FlgF